MSTTGLVSVDDRQRIEAWARGDTAMHLYEIGDLDPFFWPNTRWFAWQRDGEIRSLALLYEAEEPLTMVIVGRQDREATEKLAVALLDVLPDRYHAHIANDLEYQLEPTFELTDRGRHLKMALRPSALLDYPDEGVVRLAADDLDELLGLYERSYPENWFDPRMLETGHYFGARRDGRLVGVAGIHVYSPSYRVAALGNITTDRDYRDAGIATQVTAALCRALRETVDTVGLNVRADNLSAITCYWKLGFEIIGEYREVTAERA